MAEQWTSAHDLARTVLCAGPSCDQELEPGAVAGDLCLRCKIRQRDRERPPRASGTGPVLSDEALDHDAEPEPEPPAKPTAKKPRSRKKPGEEKPTYPCKTLGCGGTAASTWGRFSFCWDCQVRRGTRSPDGRLILRNPQSPGSHERRNATRARAEVAGPYERAALDLVNVARALDLAVVTYETAAAEWRAALDRLPADLKGPLAESLPDEANLAVATAD